MQVLWYNSTCSAMYAHLQLHERLQASLFRGQASAAAAAACRLVRAARLGCAWLRCASAATLEANQQLPECMVQQVLPVRDHARAAASDHSMTWLECKM